MLALFALGVGLAMAFWTASADAGVIAPDPAAAPLDQFIKYRTLLSEDAKEYRDFLRDTVGALVVLGTALFTFLNWRTKSDVRNEVNSQLAQAVQRVVNQSADQIRDDVADDITRRMGNFTSTTEAAMTNALSRFETASGKMNRRAEEQRTKMEATLSSVEAAITARKTYLDTFLVELSQIPPSGQADPTAKTQEEIYRGVNILWVDDFPQNNVQQRQTLESLGANVDAVTSTEAAISRLKRSTNYRVIISDMGRQKESEKAGVVFLEKLCAENIDLPVIIFASRTAIGRFGDEAISRGAYAITNGNPELFKALTNAIEGRGPTGINLTPAKPPDTTGLMQP